jgi:hypothetical protein
LTRNKSIRPFNRMAHGPDVIIAVGMPCTRLTRREEKRAQCNSRRNRGFGGHDRVSNFAVYMRYVVKLFGDATVATPDA